MRDTPAHTSSDFVGNARLDRWEKSKDPEDKRPYRTDIDVALGVSDL